MYINELCHTLNIMYIIILCFYHTYLLTTFAILNAYTMVYFIPLAGGSLAGDIELRYSLRSIEKYVVGIDSILIVGKLPEWCVNVDFVQCVDISNKFVFRDNNIRVKINLGLNIYSSIIGGNDDYYYVKPTDMNNLPNYYREIDLQTTIDRHRGGWKQYQNTRNYLLEKGKSLKMFDGHCPITYNRTAFQKVNEADWTKEYGYGIKSLYGNLNDLEGLLLHDTKIMEGLPPQIVTNTIDSSFIVSSSTRMNKHLLKYLEKEFPHKSKWER